MTMLKFIHAADIHLNSLLHGLERYEGAPVDEIRSATRRAFDNLIELAIDQEIAFVLLAGDIYDGDWKDYNTGLSFVERMGCFREAGIRVFMVAGNHDAASQITRHLRLPDNVTMFASQAPELGVMIPMCEYSEASRRLIPTEVGTPLRWNPTLTGWRRRLRARHPTA